jgi:ClpP class serine protease
VKAPAWLRRAALRHLSGDLYRRASCELLAIRPGDPMVPTVAGPVEATSGAGGYRMVADGVAEVPVCGYLSRDVDLMRAIGLSAQQTTSEMVAAFKAAESDPSVRGVMAYVDSGGGSTRGLSELVSTVAAMTKPVHVFAEAACSGAYWVAAQAERITVSQLGEVGHIGAVYRLAV